MSRKGFCLLAMFVTAACTVVGPEDERTSSVRENLTGATALIYGDSIAQDWDLNGWGWNSTANVVTSPALGANSVKVTMNAAWSGFVFAHLASPGVGGTIDPSTYQVLEFDIHPGSTVDPALSSLMLDVDNGSNQVAIADLLAHPLRPNTWSHVRVPMSVLNSANAPFFRINFFNASTSTGFSFDVDNVVLGPTPPAPVSTIGIARNTVGGQSCDEYVWYDATRRYRSADFVDDTYLGGYIRRFVYQLPDGSLRTAQGGIDASTDYQGFGYLVSHFDDGSNGGSDSADSRDPDYSSTLKNNGHSQLLWQGRHHILRQYTVDLHPRLYGSSARGTVHATVQWLVATGRAPMLFSVTYDASPNAANTVVADSRAPYGVVAWDGTSIGSANVSGVSWGDARRFVSNASNTGGNLTVGSNWTYNTTNTIPFAGVWATAPDAEMGIVSTRTYATDVSGSDAGVWFDGNGTIHGSEWLNTRCWGKTSSKATQCAQPSVDGAGAKVPGTNLWPYQLVNYGLNAQATTNKKVAWGTDYGAVGWQNVDSFGNRTYHGYPKTSYSTNVILGRRSDQLVMAEVHAQEAVRATTLTASAGAVVVSGPAGIARTDVVTYQPTGYDPVYGAWRVDANAQGTATVTFNTTSGSLVSPLFVVNGAASADPVVVLDGVMLEADEAFYASTNGDALWLTLNRTLTGSHTLTIQMP